MLWRWIFCCVLSAGMPANELFLEDSSRFLPVAFSTLAASGTVALRKLYDSIRMKRSPQRRLTRRRGSLRDLLKPADRALAECVSESIGSHVRVIQAGDKTYHRETRGWRGVTGGVKNKPLLVVVVKFEDDIPAVLECASQHGAAVSVRSGGHSLENSSLGYPGQLVLDLRSLNHIILNKRAGTVRVGPGVRAGTLLHRLDQQHLYFPLPTCLSVAMGGFLTGGGAHTLTSRLMGPAILHINAVSIFLANGTKTRLASPAFIDSDEESSQNTESQFINTDPVSDSPRWLWWAIRGGGGSFGIVAEFELSLKRTTGEMWETRQYRFPRKDFRAALKYVQFLIAEGKLPLNVHLELSLTSYGASLNLLAAPQQADIVLKSIERRLPPWLEAQETAGSPGSAHVSLGNCMSGFDPMAHTEDSAHYSKPALQPYDGEWHSMFLRAPVSSECVDLLETHAGALDPSQLFSADLTFLSPLHNINAAFPHAHYQIMLTLTLSPIKIKGLGLNLHQKDVQQFLLLYRKLKATCGEPAVYYNYLDNSLSNPLVEYFANNTQTLMQLKSIFDPKNLFSFPDSIPLAP
eukprot:Gregarina_sp_Poly_1__82@NODE_1019_length_5335_cov_515_001708_g710_i0_p1_GENE_NODE_1019_length_5335_cov_515_001708_g710_i0NODE_1019_length_5335_cov_515_001708_g710_i0_p1_ORF_typecomplete_len577_score74_65FAD_binding_4/PF01565_23/4_8e25BBE/PF08031_12/8_7e09_NODE_1019_length_5335_cov_515_001708_g710_i09842714